MYEYCCQVTRVVDGDTVDANIDLGFDISYFSRIRLFGIDTPESRTRNKDEKLRGLLAKDYIVNALANGKQVLVKTALEKKGKYGRVLGSLVVDGLDLNQDMITKHLAVAYHGQSKADIEAEHLKNRQILIKEGAYIPID
jgi:micrococcal nuclease|tara:strand:+ start:47 stop:466 length:420 start_codon:yes stop_codon:yes gene_type:complete